MKLVELVTYLRSGGAYNNFCKEQSLDEEAEVVEIYMQKPFNLKNEIAFFKIEKRKDK